MAKITDGREQALLGQLLGSACYSNLKMMVKLLTILLLKIYFEL